MEFDDNLNTGAAVLQLMLDGKAENVELSAATSLFISEVTFGNSDRFSEVLQSLVDRQQNPENDLGDMDMRILEDMASQANKVPDEVLDEMKADLIKAQRNTDGEAVPLGEMVAIDGTNDGLVASIQAVENGQEIPVPQENAPTQGMTTPNL